MLMGFVYVFISRAISSYYVYLIVCLGYLPQLKTVTEFCAVLCLLIPKAVHHYDVQNYRWTSPSPRVKVLSNCIMYVLGADIFIVIITKYILCGQVCCWHFNKKIKKTSPGKSNGCLNHDEAKRVLQIYVSKNEVDDIT